jgi:hypothetical protein
MRFKWLHVAVVFMLGTVSGCFNQVAYVEPSFHKVGYSDLQPANTRPSVGVLVEFQRYGKPFPAVTEKTRETVIQVLQKSNLFASVSSGVVGTKAQIEITINNTKGESQGSGYVTGLTAGVVGAKTFDPYIFTASYRIEGRDVIKKEYNHKLYAMLGGSGFGKDVKTMSVANASDQIVEDFVLRFLRDLQTDGAI